MSKTVLGPEVAQAELAKILNFFDVTLGNDKDNEDSKSRLLNAIAKGRMMLDEETSKIVYSLTKPIELENGQTLNEVQFREPTAGDLRMTDKLKPDEQMGKAIKLSAIICDQPLGIIERMGARDLMVAVSICSFFF